jgi:hypothetical protein
MSHEEEIAKLRAENASLDRLAWGYRGEITQAQEEIERLQSGIAALREQWQARQDAWKIEFDEEMNKRGYTAYAAILGGEWYATESVLEELDALFPPDNNIQQVEES